MPSARISGPCRISIFVIRLYGTIPVRRNQTPRCHVNSSVRRLVLHAGLVERRPAEEEREQNDLQDGDNEMNHGRHPGKEREQSVGTGADHHHEQGREPVPEREHRRRPERDVERMIGGFRRRKVRTADG